MKTKSRLAESTASIARWAIPAIVLSLSTVLVSFVPEQLPKKPALVLLGIAAVSISTAVFLGSQLYLLSVRPRPLPYPFDNQRGFYSHPSGQKLCSKCWVIHGQVSFLIQRGDKNYLRKVCDQEYPFTDST
jgi:hypothetical protein